MAKRALVALSTELLADRLQLPDGTRISGASWDLLTRCVVLEVEHDEFSDVPREHQAMYVRYRTRWVI